ncbi:hypothetical protein [Croceicoccus marinus]|uniref:Uncharacterized protein n=1 Tax=Croceicoccus marinus TaxID=450378 RepID=A0A1Z1FH91_9SPHN|nr:hypothetical protein [Croceicoccus marinus]ARU18093.1 hypothetical protein A9D14_17530 [Croceicoccus marinus]QNE06813.1 hypothetical protein H4O24_17160 [Croceicoccus marinus]
MIDPLILAGAPAHLAADPSIYRVGMLLFRKGTPGIVAHLVEAPGMSVIGQQIGAMGLTNANPISLATSVAGHAATNFQLAKIRQVLGVIENLQLANLAISGAGLGFSIISHKLLAERMDKMAQQIDGLGAKMDRIAQSIEGLRAERLQRDFNDLRTACELAEGGWQAGDPEKEWRHASDRLHTLQNEFAAKVQQSTIRGLNVDIAALEPLIDALTLAGATRISCRIAIGDLDLARTISDQFSGELNALLQGVGAAEISFKDLALRGVTPNSSNFAYEAEKVLPFATKKAGELRDREAVASTRSATISRIQALGIHGREFLERVRSETDEPLLILEGEAMAAMPGENAASGVQAQSPYA